jgi:DNA-binding NarL/FixJ family response regulator
MHEAFSCTPTAGARLTRHSDRGQRLSPALAAVGISDREAEMLDLVAQGLTSEQIAARLYTSVRTVARRRPGTRPRGRFHHPSVL